MKNNLLMIIIFSCITLSIQPASKWSAFFKSSYWSTFNRVRVAKQRELTDDDEKNKKERLMAFRQQLIPRFQQTEKPKLIPREEGGGWRDRLSKWWNSWFYPQK